MAEALSLPLSNDSPRFNVVKSNVLIVGKAGSGKSSVANHILGETHFAVSSGVYRQEQMNNHKEQQIPLKNNTMLNLTVVDTNGFYAGREFSNKAAVKEMKWYINKYISEGISLVLFVCKKGRCTAEDRATFNFIISRFDKYIKDISALVITHCEDETAEERERIIDDFRTNPQTRPIAEFMGKGIITVGFPNMDKNPAYLQMFKASIEKDEKALLDIIISQSDILYLKNELFKNEFWEMCMIL